MNINSRICKLDMFKKVPSDLSQSTSRGGFISLLTILSMAYFLYTQINGFLRPEYSARLTTGQLVTHKEMKVHLDMILHFFPCQILSLDIQDAIMSHSPNLGSIKKYRLKNGYPIDKGQDFQLLRQPNLEKQYQLAKQAFLERRGCRLKCEFTLKQAPGNFHISSHAYQDIYQRLRSQNVVSTLDMSHTILYLFFGDIDNTTSIEKVHPKAKLSKLNGYRRIYDMSGTPHSFISHYHLQVVPTLYQVPYWLNSHAYQYTFNHNTFQVNYMPCLYFNYNIGGLTIVVSTDTDSLSAFLIKLCSVLGGTYSMAAFIDSAIDKLFNDRRKEVKLI